MTLWMPAVERPADPAERPFAAVQDSPPPPQHRRLAQCLTRSWGRVCGRHYQRGLTRPFAAGPSALASLAGIAGMREERERTDRLVSKLSKEAPQFDRKFHIIQAMWGRFTRCFESGVDVNGPTTMNKG